MQIPEVVAAIETMVNAGLSSDEAATSLNAFFTAVIQASKGTGEAADLAKQLGLDFTSTALRTKGLKGFMDDLTKAVGDDEVAMQILAGNVRGFRAAASIGGKGAEFFTDTLEAMHSETGALDRAFETMADTTASKWSLAVNSAKNVGEEFGHEMLPAVNSGLEVFTDLMNAAIPVAKFLGDERNLNTVYRYAKEVTAAFPELCVFLLAWQPDLLGQYDTTTEPIWVTNRFVNGKPETVSLMA